MKKRSFQNVLMLSGVFLPIAMVFFFVVARKIPHYVYEPPKYSFLFSVDDYGNSSSEQIRVVVEQQKPKAEYRRSGSDSSYYQRTRLYLFDANTQEAREVNMIAPNGGSETVKQWTAFEVAELAGITLSTAVKSPDGYEFATASRDFEGIFPALFWGSARDNQLSLVKEGVRIKILRADRYLSSYNTKFLGWIIP